jgi:pilus assembly protein CpaF
MSKTFTSLFTKPNENDLYDKDNVLDPDKYSYDKVKQFVIDSIDSILSGSIEDNGLSKKELEKKNIRKNELKDASKDCGTGDISAKIYFKQVMADLLVKNYGINESNINTSIPFHNSEKLDIEVKFRIILNQYKQKYEYAALHMLIKKYELAKLKHVKDNIRYYIDKDEIEKIYKKEDLNLSFENKLEILVQKIYQEYKGLGVVDEIYDMNLDGIKGGVSGNTSEIPLKFRDKSLEIYLKESKDYLKQVENAKIPQDFEAVWIFYKGKSIHLRFLSFGSKNELIRVVENIGKYNDAPQLTQEKGYILNETADENRILTMRPPLCESWVFILRKFDYPVNDLEDLVKDKRLRDLLKFIMRSKRQLIALTGDMGVGKSTLMRVLLEKTYWTNSIRVAESEDFFEARLRNILPDNDIVTIKKTPGTSIEECFDILKKSDGDIMVVPEVARDPIASIMIQAALVAYKGAVFTHHGLSLASVIMALANSLVNSGHFKNEEKAKEQVIRVLGWNFHLANDLELEERYIERVSECISLYDEDLGEYTESYSGFENKEDLLKAFLGDVLLYFKKTTERKQYKENIIVEYDKEKREYIFKNPISSKRAQEMRKSMILSDDRVEFDNFMQEVFNVKVVS